MQGVMGVGASKHAQNTSNHGPRNPGTAGHPGKHLGQFKKAMAGMEGNKIGMPLILQQINAMQANTGKQVAGNKGTDLTAKSHKNDDINSQIALDALKSTQDSISDSLRFTSRFNAISTAFF